MTSKLRLQYDIIPANIATLDDAIGQEIRLDFGDNMKGSNKSLLVERGISGQRYISEVDAAYIEPIVARIVGIQYLGNGAVELEIEDIPQTMNAGTVIDAIGKILDG